MSIYCTSLTSYKRRKTNTVSIGDILLGSEHPIRVQSMTTIDTLDTLGSVDQSIRMIESGCEIVRITAPSVKEAQNLEEIKKELRTRGYNTPLVADIHFTPNAAELAARIVEKVRINPGNYADKKRFQHIEYTEESYALELERIKTRFLPLLNLCKQHGTALRIGTNHGSLSDRILSRFGDTPLGMVESALEFLRICESENFFNVVISMKSSNPQVMVQAYRLLVKRLEDENMTAFPLHLGVTEAGEGEDGRIKSAMGIGTLLEDGIGDTVRVSLTEDPEFESPVAQKLINRYTERQNTEQSIPEYTSYFIDPFTYKKIATEEVENIGGTNVPRVIADFSKNTLKEPKQLKDIGHFYLQATDKWAMNDLGADYIYTGSSRAPFMLPNGLKEIQDYSIWSSEKKYPLFASPQEYLEADKHHSKLNFIECQLNNLSKEFLSKIKNSVILLKTENSNALAELRRAYGLLVENGVKAPVIFKGDYSDVSVEEFQLFSATDFGGLFLDGMGDGIFFENTDPERLSDSNSTSFGILQASRVRITKTEYISCPSCGRTLFDLQETTAKIRKQTDHLKGIKIGIMGCIVNGPGEMADADYGYVGVGKDKIALYRGQNVVKKAVKAHEAVDQLIELIKEDGNWLTPTQKLS